jgi:hypothetical protein
MTKSWGVVNGQILALKFDHVVGDAMYILPSAPETWMPELEWSSMMKLGLQVQVPFGMSVSRNEHYDLIHGHSLLIAADVDTHHSNYCLAIHSQYYIELFYLVRGTIRRATALVKR